GGVEAQQRVSAEDRQVADEHADRDTGRELVRRERLLSQIAPESQGIDPAEKCPRRIASRLLARVPFLVAGWQGGAGNQSRVHAHCAQRIAPRTEMTDALARVEIAT